MCTKLPTIYSKYYKMNNNKLSVVDSLKNLEVNTDSRFLCHNCI